VKEEQLRSVDAGIRAVHTHRERESCVKLCEGGNEEARGKLHKYRMLKSLHDFYTIELFCVMNREERESVCVCG
jgi:hypothetical protein